MAKLSDFSLVRESQTISFQKNIQNSYILKSYTHTHTHVFFPLHKSYRRMFLCLQLKIISGSLQSRHYSIDNSDNRNGMQHKIYWTGDITVLKGYESLEIICKLRIKIPRRASGTKLQASTCSGLCPSIFPSP